MKREYWSNVLGDNFNETGFVKKVIELFAVYFVYVFLSGWAFLDHYYRYFGVDPKSLGISVPDVLVKGFTMLIGGPKLLWLMYLVILFAPFFIDAVRPMLAKAGLLLVLAALLIPTYFIASGAGLRRAQDDKSDRSQLPSVTFLLKSSPSVAYHGKLLLRTGDTYFIHGVAPVPQAGGDLELSVYRSDEIRDLKIIEHR